MQYGALTYMQSRSVLRITVLDRTISLQRLSHMEVRNTGFVPTPLKSRLESTTFSTQKSWHAMTIINTTSMQKESPAPKGISRRSE